MQKGKVLLFLAAATLAGYLYWSAGSNNNAYLAQLLESGEFLTLEARHSPEEIMDGQRDFLLHGPGYSYLKPQLKYYPYLLMEVKYSRPDRSTAEGVLLWSMVDGEMVLSTQSWDNTHGFADCIRAGANSDDFNIIRAIAKRRGGVSKETLMKDLGADGRVVERWLYKVCGKQLVASYGNEYRLHFANPRLDVNPETIMAHRFVSKPYKHTDRVAPQFSQREIEYVAKAAFGEHFAIRETQEVYLPVYSIEVKNPDGSTMTSHWNALSGNVLTDEYLQ